MRISSPAHGGSLHELLLVIAQFYRVLSHWHEPGLSCYKKRTKAASSAKILRPPNRSIHHPHLRKPQH